MVSAPKLESTDTSEAKAAAEKTPEVSQDPAEIHSSSGTLAAPERTYRPWGESTQLPSMENL
jgi:hypothetical protein